MKNSINEYEFNRWFKQHRPNNFSYAGRQALFEYLEQYEEDCDTEIEFDPIALCCEYSEYDSIAEFHLDYDAETYPDKDAIMDSTQVIEFGVESFIIQQF